MSTRCRFSTRWIVRTKMSCNSLHFTSLGSRIGSNTSGRWYIRGASRLLYCCCTFGNRTIRRGSTGNSRGDSLSTSTNLHRIQRHTRASGASRGMIEARTTRGSIRFWLSVTIGCSWALVITINATCRSRTSSLRAISPAWVA